MIRINGRPRESGQLRALEHVTVDNRFDHVLRVRGSRADRVRAVPTRVAALHFERQRPPRRPVRPQVEIGRSERARARQHRLPPEHAADRAAHIDLTLRRHDKKSRQTLPVLTRPSWSPHSQGLDGGSFRDARPGASQGVTVLGDPPSRCHRVEHSPRISGTAVEPRLDHQQR